MKSGKTPANAPIHRGNILKTRPQLFAAGMTVAMLSFNAATHAQVQTVNWTGGSAATDRNWSTPGNFDGPVGSTSAILFTDIDSATTNTINNFVDQSFTISSLTYSNYSTVTSPGYVSFQNTQIQPGVTLTVTNGLVVGVGKDAGFPLAPYTYATIKGTGGALAVTAGDVRIGYQSSGSATLFLFATLDMSGLDLFIQNIDATNVFGVASYPQRRADGEVFMAKTNFITARKVLAGVGVSGSASGPGIMHLGNHNVLNADTMRAGQDAAGTMDFESSVTNGYLKMRGSDGVSSVGSYYIGSTFSASSAYGFATNDWSAGTVDASFVNLSVGLHSGNIAALSRATTGRLILSASSSNVINATNFTIGTCPGGGSTTALTFSFGTLDMAGGTFNARSVVVGSASYAGTASGILNLTGGTFHAGSVALATSLTNGTSTGFLNISGGSMLVDSNIACGPNGTINITNANFVLGGSISNLNNLNLSNAVLSLSNIGTNATITTANFTVDGSNTIAVTSSALAVGQFPLIAYSGGIQGPTGFGGLNLTLPAGVSATLVDNSANQSVDLLVTAVTVTPPVLTSISSAGAHNFGLIGSGLANHTYKVYATTNLNSPVSWQLIDSVNADPSGAIQYHDTNATSSLRFYRLGN